MRDEPVPAQELEDAKAALVLSLPADFATAGATAGRIADLSVHGLPDDYWNRYADRVRQVTADDVRRFAATLPRPLEAHGRDGRAPRHGEGAARRSAARADRGAGRASFGERREARGEEAAAPLTEQLRPPVPAEGPAGPTGRGRARARPGSAVSAVRATLARPPAPGAPMAELQNEFSWSKSRHEKFRECPRAYFFAYYGCWGGWEAPAASQVRELYVLKKLSSRWQWAGSLVHDALKRALSRAKGAGELPPLEQVLERTRAKARAEWAGSREKSYWREASRIVGLVEHEYGEAGRRTRTGSGSTSRSSRARSARSGRAPVLEEIRRTPRERWLTVDELDSWTFEGTKIWVAVDFAYRDGDGRVHVLDWKTGQGARRRPRAGRRCTRSTRSRSGACPRRRWWAGSSTSSANGGPRAASGSRSRPTPRRSPLPEAMRASIAAMKATLADPGAERRARGRVPAARRPRRAAGAARSAGRAGGS